VLRKFLVREHIFYYPKIREEYEERARANIQFEVDHLETKGML